MVRVRSECGATEGEREGERVASSRRVTDVTKRVGHRLVTAGLHSRSHQRAITRDNLRCYVDHI